MKHFRRAACIAFACILTTGLIPDSGLAQLISLKTVPVATGDQFMVHPSENIGMGELSIALDDRLRDPFVNPAKAVRLRGTQVIGAPMVYNVTNSDAGARTLPITALIGNGNWFSGVSMAVQQLEMMQPQPFLGGWRTFDLTAPPQQQRPLGQRYANNLYATALLGRQLPDSDFSVAGSISWAGLEGVAGVDLLYPRSQNIAQSGSVMDYRIGLFADFNDRQSFEAILLFNHIDMMHEVTYGGWHYDDQTHQTLWLTHDELNPDETITIGAHLGYTHSFLSSGVTLGSILTANYKTHPKIPNYELMNIPRDPGNTYAYNVGFGVSRKVGAATLGLDLIFEPIKSHTWADTDVPVESESGHLIPVGGKTVENFFQFSNALIRSGVQREGANLDFQLGLQMRSIGYRLDQTNFVDEFQRSQTERWAEWTTSWSATIKFSEFNLRYTGRLITGTGTPGVESPWWGVGGFRAMSADFIIAPGGSLTLQEAAVLTHQISVAVPIGK